MSLKNNTNMFKFLKNKYFLVTLLFLLWILFFDTNNIIRWFSNINEVKEQEKQKIYYKRQIEITDEKLKELGSNRDSLEKFAREQYLFHEPSEEIFLVEPSK